MFDPALEGWEMFQSSYSFKHLIDKCFCEKYNLQNSGEFNNFLWDLILLAEIASGKSIHHIQSKTELHNKLT